MLFVPQHQDVVKHSVHTLIFRSLKRTHDMFISEEGLPIPEDEERYVKLDILLCQVDAFGQTPVSSSLA